MLSMKNKAKVYYIRDLEKALGVSRDTYFYWERVGKVPKPKRTKMGNYRYWTGAAVERLNKKITGR